ncbi:hypothetical protein B0H19DRAFT_919700, partial [Mycena capillaripes]
LVGNLLHWGLFGGLTVQLYIYYQAFPNDRLRIKYVVYAMYILELLQTVLITHDAFADLGFGFGDPSSLFQIRLGWFTVPILSSMGISSS